MDGARFRFDLGFALPNFGFAEKSDRVGDAGVRTNEAKLESPTVSRLHNPGGYAKLA